MCVSFDKHCLVPFCSRKLHDAISHFIPFSTQMLISAEGLSRFPYLKHITSPTATTPTPPFYPFIPVYFNHSIFHPTFHYIPCVYSHQWVSFVQTVGASSCSLLIPSACEGWEASGEHSLNEKMNDSGYNGDFNPGQAASKTHVLPIILHGSLGLVSPSLQKVVLALNQAVNLVLSLPK